MRPLTSLALLAALAAAASPSVRADWRTKAAREAAEYAAKKFGRTAVKEGTETLAERIAAGAARHGDDMITAVRKVGPKALTLADEAGEQAPAAVRILSRHGEEAAVWVLGRPGAMRLLARHGDDAAEALVKHKGLAEPVIERLGGPAVDAFRAVGPRSGRRLAMMAQDGGDLAAIGRTPEVLGVIGRLGDPAMDFIWRNKGALTVGATLTAFLARPEAFIDGTNRLAGTVAENAVKPAVQEAVGAFAWLLRAATVLIVLIPAGTAFLAIRHPQAAAVLGRAIARHMAKGRNP
ncbi:hypothetical protein [Tautonia sociabilis]|uniref:DUF4197 domain-containing protein n=1 Tax=Tautonia sociabilis TaxID=2080755 RepID=A0A432MPM8_9BACT|nr:hypothetical protein [Tautonia sociabilis]RUL89423.1 hypothetical protein TsocGM_01235 [Tautonia sociabilis]